MKEKQNLAYLLFTEQLRAEQQVGFRQIKERNNLLHVSRLTVWLTDCWQHVTPQAACWQPSTHQPHFLSDSFLLEKGKQLLKAPCCAHSCIWEEDKIPGADMAVFDMASLNRTAHIPDSNICKKQQYSHGAVLLAALEMCAFSLTQGRNKPRAPWATVELSTMGSPYPGPCLHWEMFLRKVKIGTKIKKHECSNDYMK